jgi:hypothetical protein
MITQEEMRILINTLSNIYDWSSENLEKDFVSFIQSEIKTIPEDKIVNLFNKFESIPTLERESIHFNFESFIRNNLKH